MAALANRKIGAGNMKKSLLALPFGKHSWLHFVCCYCWFVFPAEVVLAAKEDSSSAPQAVGQVLLTLILNVVDNPLMRFSKQTLLVY